MALDLSTAAIGEIVAKLTPPASGALDLVRYAKASGDLNPLHLDPDFARQAGFDNVVVHGMLSMAHLGRLVTDNFPVDRLKAFSARFEGVVTAGQRVAYTARLSEVCEGRATLALEGVVEATGKVAISGRALIDVD